MSTSLPFPGKQFAFTKDGKFLDNQASAGINVTANAEAAMILAANTPFPAGTTTVGTLSANLGGNPGDLKFPSGQGVVSFSAAASTNSRLAVYGSSSDLIKDLSTANQQAIDGLTLDAAGATQFVVLDWGYHISASAKGSATLGDGAAATLAVDATARRMFAVIRGFPAPPPSRDAIQSTVTSWMLPGHVASVDDLEPGTWLVAEVDGSIAVKIGAKYGYDYNWIRKVDLGPLEGDVGLKIQAAVDASVGFEASGKYLLVVARESVESSSKIVRVRISKIAKKGWDFAFNTRVGVTGSTGALLPSQIDDFIAAVFGVHGAQVVEDLKLFDKWTDPNTPLPDLLAGFVSDFVTKELRSHLGTEIQKYQAARQRIADFLKQWKDLGHSTATLLWSEVQKSGGPAAGVLDFLKQANGLDDAGLSRLIATRDSARPASRPAPSVSRWSL